MNYALNSIGLLTPSQLSTVRLNIYKTQSCEKQISIYKRKWLSNS